MRVFVRVPIDYLPNGIHTSVRGHSGWGLKLAKLFSDLGHDVYLNSRIQPYKEYDIIENIHYVDSSLLLEAEENFDVSFVFEYSDGLGWAKEIKSHKKIFGGFGPPNFSHLKTVPDDAIFITPYHISDLSGVVSHGKFLLPYNFGEFEEPKFESKRIAVTTKIPFANGCHKDCAELSLKQFKILCELADEGVGIDLFCFDTYLQSVENSVKVEVEDVLDRLVNKKSVSYHNLMPFDEFEDKLRKCSISIVSVGTANSIAECLYWGIVPLVFGQSSYNFFNQSLFSKLGVDTKISSGAIKSKIKKLLNDREYFNNDLDLIRKNSAIYSNDFMLEQINSLLCV